MILHLFHSILHNWLFYLFTCIIFISFIIPRSQLKFIHPILLILLHDYIVYKQTKKYKILQKDRFQLPSQQPSPH